MRSALFPVPHTQSEEITMAKNDDKTPKPRCSAIACGRTAYRSVEGRGYCGLHANELEREIEAARAAQAERDAYAQAFRDAGRPAPAWCNA